MTAVGVTFPEADDSVKHAVQRMNTAFELGRKTACLPGGGLKEAHQVMLHELGQARAAIDQMPKEDIPCEQSRMVENMFASYSGPDVPFFDEWKTLFLGLEEDAISLVCKDDRADPKKALDSMDRIARSSYKSICGSDEVLTAMTQEDAMKITKNKLTPQIEAVSNATDSAAEKSGVNLEPIKEVAKEAVATVSCPSGLGGVITAHYQIMIGVFFAGFIIAFLILRRR
tara:strand:+ start:809 stop:1492 length:684 start_codon:yes stop_codon:yes gene_type:complete